MPLRSAVAETVSRESLGKPSGESAAAWLTRSDNHRERRLRQRLRFDRCKRTTRKLPTAASSSGATGFAAALNSNTPRKQLKARGLHRHENPALHVFAAHLINQIPRDPTRVRLANDEQVFRRRTTFVETPREAGQQCPETESS